MKILVIEDDQEFFDAEILPRLKSAAPNAEISNARSREAALEKITSSFSDIILLDMKLPAVDGQMDTNEDHGVFVFHEARKHCPGTPIFILTGSESNEFFPDLIKQAQQVDVWGSGAKLSTVDYLPKRKLDAFHDRIASLSQQIEGLRDIEIRKEAKDTPYSEQEDRLLRTFVRRRGGVKAAVATLTGGLSDARVVRLQITDDAGAPRDAAIGKLARLPLVARETMRYTNAVSRLPAAATPRFLETLVYGAKDLGGVFYQLADAPAEPLFSVAKNFPEIAAAAVQQVEELTARWRDGVPESPRRISDIRRLMVDDAKAAELWKTFDLPWAPEFESRRLQTKWCCVHGDLHGGNILVNAKGRPVLIDYNDIGDGPASLDPLTIELGFLFHPAGTKVMGAWSISPGSADWGDENTFFTGCEFVEALRACRAWLRRVAAGEREIAAAGYAYALRQLKFVETDKALALQLVNSFRRQFEAA